MTIEKITYAKQLLAIIIRKRNYPIKIGANFITNNSDPLQVGFINYPSKHIIKPHMHIKRKKIINSCPEVLLVQKGILDVFFDKENGQKINIKKKTKKW